MARNPAPVHREPDAERNQPPHQGTHLQAAFVFLVLFAVMVIYNDLVKTLPSHKNA